MNGLAKLRRRLLILGITNMGIAAMGMLVLVLALFYPERREVMEGLVALMVALLVVNAENKHAIYTEQYTDEHKEISARIQKEINQRGNL